MFILSVAYYQLEWPFHACLSCVLLNRGDQVPNEVLPETLVDSLSFHDATTIKLPLRFHWKHET